MLVDLEGNYIEIAAGDNEHMKIIGRSGSGKTFYACRYIESIYDKKCVIIIDFSGSYTQKEFEKSKLNKDILVHEINMKQNKLFLYNGDTQEDVVENMVDALIVTIGIDAMMQRQVLQEACEQILRTKHYISIKLIYDYLDGMDLFIEDVEVKKNVNFLKKRLYHLRKFDSLRVCVGNQNYNTDVHLIQLSDFTQRIRVDMTQMILELLWRSMFQKAESNVQIILDEFQYIKLKNTAVEEMMRVGRRKGVGITLLSQFNPNKEATDVLEQSATSLYFKPNEQNITAIAKMIESEKFREWKFILQNLSKGTCVLKGEYTINGSERVVSRPIVCKVIMDGNYLKS